MADTQQQHHRRQRHHLCDDSADSDSDSDSHSKTPETLRKYQDHHKRKRPRRTSIRKELEEIKQISITTNRVLFVIIIALVIVSSVIVFVPPCSKLKTQ